MAWQLHSLLRQSHWLRLTWAAESPGTGGKTCELPMNDSGNILRHVFLPHISGFDLFLCLLCTDRWSSDHTASGRFPICALCSLSSGLRSVPYLSALGNWQNVASPPQACLPRKCPCSSPLSPNKTPQSEPFLTSSQAPYWNLSLTPVSACAWAGSLTSLDSWVVVVEDTCSPSQSPTKFLKLWQPSFSL